MRNKSLAGIVAGLTLLTAACGSDTPDAEAPAATVADATVADVTVADVTVPSTMSDGMGDDTVPETTVPETTVPEAATTVAGTEPSPGADDSTVPTRIVSLSPTATEIMFAIGADDLLVAVDDYSNFPAAALDLPHELSGYEPNVEAIAGYEPELVLLPGDYNGLGDQLSPLGIEVYDGAAATTIDDTYAQIEQLGAITGHVGEAAELVGQMQADIDEIVAGVTPAETPLTYYHELDPTLYSVTSDTFIGQIYSLVGLENIADTAATDGNSYPQLNAEFVVEASPDLIFLADTKCCAETAATVGARPGWDAIAAVQNGDVIEMDDDIASRWGPRIVDYLRAVADAVNAASVAA